MGEIAPEIVQYYLLCSTRLGARKHVISDLEPAVRSIVFTKKEISLYLREHDGVYVAREIVIGGGKNREPVIVYA